MKRTQILILVLVALLVAVLFFFFAVQPQRERAAELDEEIALEQEQQALLQAEISRLRSVRDEAPEVEADLAAANAIVPRDASLPSALRQLQLASDEAGLVLSSISTARPAGLPDALEGLSSISVTLQMSGSYFQVVDFLRRVEDPGITPRGLTWNDINVGRAEYPELNVALNGQLYTAQPAAPPPPEPEPEVGEDGEPLEDGEVGPEGDDLDPEDELEEQP
ncbi:MAG: type II secretion system protein GspM [Nitriliruptoraceae bacterium]